MNLRIQRDLLSTQTNKQTAYIRQVLHARTWSFDSLVGVDSARGDDQVESSLDRGTGKTFCPDRLCGPHSLLFNTY